MQLAAEKQYPPDSPQGESAEGLEGKTDTAEEKEITFTEQVVADNEKCKITITGFERDDEWGIFYINTLLENKSSDKTYTFSLDSSTVNINGVTIYAFPDIGHELAPGEKRNEKFELYDFALNYNDIGDYTDIELVFQVYNYNRKKVNVLERKTVHIYPYGEDKAAEFVREAQPSDKIILDNEYVTVIFAGECNEKFKEFYSSEYMFEMFVINKTDKVILIRCYPDSFSVNGQEEIGSWYTKVHGGKCSFSTISFYNKKEDLEKYGIKDYEDFKEIKFKFFIIDSGIDDDGFYYGENNKLSEHEITLNP